MRGLAINIIGIMIIAITGVAILLMYISGPLSSTVNTTFCYFSDYLGISPDFCENKFGLSKNVKFDMDSEEDLARYLSAYSVLCWKEATEPLRRKDLICYQIFVDKPVGAVSESYFTELMEAENGCDELQNSIIKDKNGAEI